MYFLLEEDRRGARSAAVRQATGCGGAARTVHSLCRGGTKSKAENRFTCGACDARDAHPRRYGGAAVRRSGDAAVRWYGSGP